MRPRSRTARFASVASVPPRALFGLAVRGLQRPGELEALSAYHITMRPGARHPPALHVHRDELILVLEGTGSLRVGNFRRRLAKGVTVYVPAKAVHEVTAGPGGLKVLSLFTPAMDPRKPDIRILEERHVRG